MPHEPITLSTLSTYSPRIACRPVTGFTPRLVIEGATYAAEEEQPRAAQINATPGYFDVLDIRVREGRLFNDGDLRETERVALAKFIMRGKENPKPSDIPTGSHVRMTLSSDGKTVLSLFVVRDAGRGEGLEFEHGCASC